MGNQRQIGREYEKMAAEYLEACGFQILSCNYRCRYGEIDLIAKDGEVLVFCEVKYRSDTRKENRRRQSESRSSKQSTNVRQHTCRSMG